MPNYIAFAIPVFFVAIGIEVAVAFRRKRHVYRFTDAISDLSAGITQQTLLVFQTGALLFGYTWVYDHHRLASLPSSSALTWVAAMVLVDLVYYWWHRLSHEVNFLWAAHVVHHSSEDYNLAVALRQGILTPWTSVPLHLLLALAGFPPVVVATADSFNTLYQFWIHTELVGKLGWFERLFNSPSHHRVHHGINPQYLDKNYGGILIVWDRLFGTFELEVEPVVYGLVKPLRSYNPLWVQLHRWVELAEITSRSKHPIDRFKVWLMSPPWMPRDLPQFPPTPRVSPETFAKYDPREPLGLQLFVVLQLIGVVVAVTTLMFMEDGVPMRAGLTVTALVLATVTAWGALAERKRWAFGLELALLLGTAASLVAAVAARHPGASVAVPTAAIGVAAMLLAAWVLRYREGVPRRRAEIAVVE